MPSASLSSAGCSSSKSDDQDQQLELMQDGYHSPVPQKLRWRSWAADSEGITGEELLTFVNTQLFPELKKLSITGKQVDRRKVVRDVFEDAYNYMKSGQLMRQVVNKINEVDFNNLAERQHFGDIYEQILTDLQSAGNAGEYYTPRAVTAFMVDRIDPHPGEILLDPACGTGGFLTCALRHMRDRFGGGFANFSERHPHSLVAGERALERPNAGMHTNGSSVSRHFIFQLVPRFNSQSLSNFLGNGRLSLTRHRRMKHHHILTFQFILTSTIPLLPL